MAIMPQPIKLARAEHGGLLIQWSDGQQREYSFRELRQACPCATCREKRMEEPKPASLLPILTAAETKPLDLASMTPVGNYAYNIGFSDGHDTGIYPMELLRELGKEVK